MTGAVCAVVSVGAGADSLQDTVGSLQRQDGAPIDVVIVTTPELHERRRAVEGIASACDARVVVAPGDAPGVCKNAGIRVSTGSLVILIDEGDVLDPAFVGTMSRSLESQTAAGMATSWVREERPNTPARLLLPPAFDLPSLLRRPPASHAPYVLRRAVWEAIGAFDETLLALDVYDFLVRAVQAGVLVEAIGQPLVRRLMRPESAYRRGLDPERYVSAFTAIREKFRPSFEADPAAALYERERELAALVLDHSRLVQQRDRMAAEHLELEARLGTLREELDRGGRTGIDFGDLRRVDPVSRDWGYDRGKPIDRFYIERFLETNAADVQGVVLEVQEPDFTRHYGGERVTRSEVIDFNPSNPRATIVADFRNAPEIASDTFDCIILTQTLHVIDDMIAVVRECFRILKPGGVLLVTLPCASRVCLEYGKDGDFWRMTEAGARALFTRVFPRQSVEARSFGNVLVNAAFMYGLACHEVDEREFDAFDPYNPLLVGVRAVKPSLAEKTARVSSAPARHRSEHRGLVLMYHRVGEPLTDVHELSVSPALFGAQMEHLRRNFAPMPLLDLVAAARDGRLPPRAVAVTFDDGYLDNLTHACPILADLRIPATLFVTSGGLEEEREYLVGHPGAHSSRARIHPVETRAARGR